MAQLFAPLHVVWYKRDLRLSDHAPLRAAARRAPVVGLYVYEPELYTDPEFDAAHLEFINQSLLSLETDLARLGGRLLYRKGKMPDVLEALHQEYGVAGLYAHEETGNAVSFARDKRVRTWVKARGVPFYEFPNGAVLRGKRAADTRGEAWRSHWFRTVYAPVLEPPKRFISAPIPIERHQTPWDLGLEPTRKTLPVAGESAAHDVLESFLDPTRIELRAGHLEPGTLPRQLVAPESIPGVGKRLEPSGLSAERP